VCGGIKLAARGSVLQPTLCKRSISGRTEWGGEGSELGMGGDKLGDGGGLLRTIDIRRLLAREMEKSPIGREF
jgi:hypothetical protein